MVRCSTCSAWINDASPECPTCGRSDTTADSPPNDSSGTDSNEPVLQAIARFRHAAEAGFFLDELTRRLDITAEVVPKENFDSLHASWSTDFVLMVPRDFAYAAASCLQELVEQSADEPSKSDSEAPARPRLISVQAGVAALLLTFAAGAVSCWGFERLERPRVARQDRVASALRIVDEMSTHSTPWVQSLPNGKGTRRVTFDQKAGSVIWEEDRDGDRDFEIHRVTSTRQ